MRAVLPLVIIVVVIIVGFAVMQLVNTPEQTPQQVENVPVNTADVFVAKEPIAAGTIISEEMVDKQPWPQHLLLEGFIISDNQQPANAANSAANSNVVGMVARADFQKNEPFIIDKLSNPNDANFIAAALPEGMRAITLSVDAISGIAGFVFAGDRVDILLAHNIPQKTMGFSGTSTPINTYLTEVLVPNVRVLAVDLRNTQQHEQSLKREGQIPAPKAPANVTLAVTPEEAQRVRLAERNGTLSLALKPLHEKEVGEVPAPTNLPQLTTFKDKSAPGQPNQVVIVRGVKQDAPSQTPVNPNLQGGFYTPNYETGNPQ